MSAALQPQSDALISLELSQEPLCPFTWLSEQLADVDDPQVQAGRPWLEHVARHTQFRSREPAVLVAVGRMAIDGDWADTITAAAEELDQLVGSRDLWQDSKAAVSMLTGEGAQLDTTPLSEPINAWAYWQGQMKAQLQAVEPTLEEAVRSGQVTAQQAEKMRADIQAALDLFGAASALPILADDPTMLWFLGRLTPDPGLRRAVAAVGATTARLIDAARSHVSPGAGA